MTLTPEILAEIDEPCRELVIAMNKLPGIRTTECCCGHGHDEFRIFFKAVSLDYLPPLLYWFSGCHSGCYGWNAIARTDCGMCPVYFYVESTEKGEEAYRQANKIAQCITNYMAEQDAEEGG